MWPALLSVPLRVWAAVRQPVPVQVQAGQREVQDNGKIER
jgi:hypothetical protein